MGNLDEGFVMQTGRVGLGLGQITNCRDCAKKKGGGTMRAEEGEVRCRWCGGGRERKRGCSMNGGEGGSRR